VVDAPKEGAAASKITIGMRSAAFHPSLSCSALSFVTRREEFLLWRDLIR
jgi:hypothetical protein